MLDNREKIKIDQSYLETVIPAIGNTFYTINYNNLSNAVRSLKVSFAAVIIIFTGCT